jgi:hypothetical protein
MIISDVSAYKNAVGCDIFSDEKFLNCVIDRAFSMHMRDDVHTER